MILDDALKLSAVLNKLNYDVFLPSAKREFKTNLWIVAYAQGENDTSLIIGIGLRPRKIDNINYLVMNETHFVNAKINPENIVGKDDWIPLSRENLKE